MIKVGDVVRFNHGPNSPKDPFLYRVNGVNETKDGTISLEYYEDGHNTAYFIKVSEEEQLIHILSGGCSVEETVRQYKQKYANAKNFLDNRSH